MTGDTLPGHQDSADFEMQLQLGSDLSISFEAFCQSFTTDMAHIEDFNYVGYGLEDLSSGLIAVYFATQVSVLYIEYRMLK